MIILKTELLPFQIPAVEKMMGLKVGALYMEMGLGKSRTSLELIKRRYDKGKIDHVIWFCPCSTKTNLLSQIREHSEGAEKIISIFGIESISKSERIYLEVIEELHKYQKIMLIVDESNLVKNHKAIRSKRMVTIASMCTYKLILNGTPITRNEADLFNQWYILDWRILKYRSYYSFSSNHLEFDEKTKRIVKVLHPEYLTDKIAPYTYQLKKEDALELPEKNYRNFYFDLTKEQIKHYKEIKDLLLEEVYYKISIDDWDPSAIFKLLTALQLITSGRKIVKTKPHLEHKPFFKNIEDNPRIIALENNLPDEKTIIWCRYTDEILAIKNFLIKKYGIKNVCTLYGELSQKKRDIEIEKFKNEAKYLVGNKNCGGYGLNLQFCNNMIFYSNNYDWGSKEQAEDRIHRIGQKNKVFYLDIIADDTVDERIKYNLDKKDSLSNTLKKLLEAKNDKKILSDWLDGKNLKGESMESKNKGKIYKNKNVFVAAQERISYIFDEFKNICISFSGGKDSGVCLNLMIDEARKRKRKFGVMFIDVEASYEMTIEFVKTMIEENRDVIIPYWISLPMESPNSLSYLEPTWIWWDKEKEAIWVREIPEMEYVITEENNPIDLYKKNMPFEEFVKIFGLWFGKGEKTAIIVGLRTDESLNRYRAIVAGKKLYKNKKYSTNIIKEIYNFYPIYDWRVEDIWTYNGKYNKKYNPLYNLMYKAGVSISQMRVDEPFGNESKAGLNLFKVIEPATWIKVVNRVSGANFGNIYHGTKIMKSNYTLPKNHTWKSFTKFLLSTLPPATAAHYKIKFIKFIKYWYKKGCPIPEDMIELLESKYSDYIENSNSISNRGAKNKTVIRFRKILDEAPEIGMAKQFLTWKRMAMCIIKNDFLCKGLYFGTTKDLTVRQQKIMEKYKGL